MHFTTLSAAFFMALASAHSNHPHHFHMRRALNATVPSTTLTVYATETKTILSCAATVTNCPAHPEKATSQAVVTVTKAIATTVCPVADASSISSSIISAVTPAAVVPHSTSARPGVSNADAIVGSTDTVLTYTLGTGTSTTVVTTTIRHTETRTVYATITNGVTAQGGDEYSEDGVAGEPSPSETDDLSGAGSAEPTTTLTSILTHTKFVTVYPVPTGVTVQGSAGSGSDNCAPVAPVTVTIAATTVTIAATTVTVVETKTETAAATCPTPSEAAPLHVAAVTSAKDGIGAAPVYSGAAALPVPVVTSAKDGIGAAPTNAYSNVVVIESTATLIPIPVTSAPYAIGNGTHHSGGASPTILPNGYAYKRKA